jgi:hypothetical protein
MLAVAAVRTAAATACVLRVVMITRFSASYSSGSGWLEQAFSSLFDNAIGHIGTVMRFRRWWSPG